MVLEVKAKLKTARQAYNVKVKGQLRLPFELRQKPRQRATLVSGEKVALLLPRGELLRGGDLVVASDGRVIEVIAEPEQVLHVCCSDATALAKAAYHLGNRHVPVEVGDGYLRIGADQVLAEMLRGLGATLEAMTAPFEPEVGTSDGELDYPHDHDHDSDHAPVLDHAHGDDHGHAHDHGHGHSQHRK